MPVRAHPLRALLLPVGPNQFVQPGSMFAEFSRFFNPFEAIWLYLVVSQDVQTPPFDVGMYQLPLLLSASPA